MAKMLKYLGLYPMFYRFDGFVGRVQPGESIMVGDRSFEELKGHDDWEPVADEAPAKSTKKPSEPKEGEE